MRGFFRNISCFVLLILLLAFGLDYMISMGLRRMDCYKYQMYNEVFEGDHKYDMLYMGNSRCFSHFNPRIIDSICHVNSYGLGLGGYSIDVQIAEYHCYKAHQGAPKVIVQQVDFRTLRMDHDIRRQHDSERFFPAVYDMTVRKELKQLGYGFWELYCPLYRYLGYQQAIKQGLLEFLRIKHHVERPAYKGFSPENGEWNGANLTSMDSIDTEMDTNALALFESYLDECKKDGVFVLLVNTPVYYQATEKTKNLNLLNDYLEKTADRYGFTYMNYTSDYPMCFDTLNFCVSVHLNAEAADRFSNDFAEDVLSLGVLPQSPPQK